MRTQIRFMAKRNSHNIDKSKNPSLPTPPNSKPIPVPSQNNDYFQFGVYTSRKFYVINIFSKYIIFGEIKLIHIVPKLAFFHCLIYSLFEHIDQACFLSCWGWMYHIHFANPQVTFKLSLICDLCKQCGTTHPYTHMQIFLWDRY